MMYDSDFSGDIGIENLGVGDHVITVTVYDGEFHRSALVRITVEALPPPPVEEEGMSQGLLVGLVMAIVLVVVITLFVVMRRRGGRFGVTDNIGDGETSGAPDDRGEGLYGPGPSTAERASSEDIPALPLTRDGALEALRGLPRALPPELWGYEVEELATMVVEAPSGMTTDGRPVVEVDGRWYLADVGDPGTLMEVWTGEVDR